MQKNNKSYLLRSNGIINQMFKATQKYYYKFRYNTNTIFNSESQSEAWVLGKHLTSFKAIQTEINRIIWMTYRQNMGKSQFVRSDVGWGCMIRVGQMMLAEAFRRTLNIKEQQNQIYEEEVVKHIISGFIDSIKEIDFGQYSIQNICEYAIKNLKLSPGAWFNPSHISHCLSGIHKQNPLGGTAQLLVKVDYSIDFDLWKADMVKAGERTSLLIIMMCMLGYNKPQKSKIDAIYKLMKLKQFNGMLGGIPSKAFYFVGVTKLGNFIYLDPHLVQNASTTTHIQFQTYFCEQYLSIGPDQLQSSVGITFYLNDLHDFEDFFSKVSELKNSKIDVPFGLVGLKQNRVTGIYEYEETGSFAFQDSFNPMACSAFEIVGERDKEQTEDFEFLNLE